jgi:hypothetical protein
MGRHAQTDSGKQNAFSARYFGTPSSVKGVAMNKAGPLQEKELTPTLRWPRERPEFASHPYRFPCRYSRRRYPFRYRALRTSVRGESRWLLPERRLCESDQVSK